MQKRTPLPTDVKLSPSVRKEVWERLKSLSSRERRSLNDILNEWIEQKLSEAEAAVPPAEGRKGGYRSGGLPAMVTADRA